jgi:membrane protein implicated in regulation of membrane protease activity
MGLLVWIVVAIGMAVLEMVSTGLITVWFVVGALVSLVASVLGAPDWLQLVLFLAVSLLCLVLLRPLALKHRNNGPSAEPTVVGQQAVVCEALGEAPSAGRVELSNHMTWAAVSADGNPIEAGSVVRVVGQESVTLVVERSQA